MLAQCYTSRRTPSNTTFSTFTSSGNGSISYRKPSEDLQRSTSSRYNGTSQSTSYVALMRRQKATVWCERAQLEDPRLQAQLKAAKVRATQEVKGNPAIHRVSTSGSGSISSGNRVAAKIRNHGKSSVIGYNPGDLVRGVGGIPLRLSATEVEGYDSNDDRDFSQMPYSPKYGPTSSGRSSGASDNRDIYYPRHSMTNSVSGKWSESKVQVVDRHLIKNGHFFSEDGTIRQNSSTVNRRNGSGSNSSRSTVETIDTLPELYTGNTFRRTNKSLLKSAVSQTRSFETPELKRIGSVDDRPTTKNTVRLYIANPDVDSD